MLQVFKINQSNLEKTDGLEITIAMIESQNQAYWFDLLNPSLEEIALIEKQLNIELPNNEDMQDLEQSELNYYKNAGVNITCTTIFHTAEKSLKKQFVAFIIKDKILISLRYSEFLSFNNLIQYGHLELLPSSDSAFACLFDLMIERIAGVLAILGNNIDELSQEIFCRESLHKKNSLTDFLYSVGKNAQNISKTAEAITSLTRASSFAKRYLQESHIEAMSNATKDLRILDSHANFLEEKTFFLQDAVLGLINIEQNKTINVLSILAVIFMPPTMIASIYGMNFSNIPGLDWTYGFHLSIISMCISVIGLYWILKRKKLF